MSVPTLPHGGAKCFKVWRMLKQSLEKQYPLRRPIVYLEMTLSIVWRARIAVWLPLNSTSCQHNGVFALISFFNLTLSAKPIGSNPDATDFWAG